MLTNKHILLHCTSRITINFSIDLFINGNPYVYECACNVHISVPIPVCTYDTRCQN